MARKKNSEINEGTIIVGFSLLKELKPKLPELAAALGLKTQSEILTMLAVDVEASARALRPLLANLEEHQRARQVDKEQRRERMNVLQSLSAEEFERVVKAATVAEPTENADA